MTSKSSFPKILLTIAGIAMFASMTIATPSPAFAAGDDAPIVKTPSCKRGFVFNKRKKKCVKVKKSSNLSDDNIYWAAKDLAYSKRYTEAIALLKLAKNQKDPRILNYLGYSTRKSGKLKKGLWYYHAAIEVDPDYTLARSYMGEAYLQLNNPTKAKEQLVEIGKRCGLNCREYGILEKKSKPINLRLLCAN